jgi:hypothetical protein
LVYGISGGNTVGQYRDASYKHHGYFYDGTNWASLDYPGATETSAASIDGNNVVGYYDDASDNSHGFHGFFYDGATWTTLDYPGATSTVVRGIDGNNVVGFYEDSSGDEHGFLYDGTTWTTLGNCPWAVRYVRPWGIDGHNIVGVYADVSGWHGFHYTIPEPSSLCLITLGSTLLLRRRMS